MTTRIVYVGAVGRSGTTLLERLVATSPDFVSLGETVHLWERGVAAGEPCGCGERFVDCPFWSAVGTRAFGPAGWSAIDVEDVLQRKRAVDRNRYIPWLVAPRLAPRRYREALSEHVDLLGRLFDAVAAVATERAGHPVVLVDASKHPSYYFLVRHAAGLDVRLLHVVRDPRGVAHSWAKVVARPEAGDDMERLGTLQAVARWTSHNLIFSFAGLGHRHRRMQYERFTEDPAELTRAIGELTSDLDVRPPVFDGRTAELRTDHTASGNPMRFRVGPVEIRHDDAWRTAMPSAPRRLVGALTMLQRRSYR